MLAQRTGGEELPKGLDAAWDAAMGLGRRFVTRTEHFLRLARRVAAMEKQFATMSDANLRTEALELRELFRRGRERPEQRDRAFAVVCEVAFRQIGERPHFVQIAGAMAIDAGCVAEMATGEGKTLTATMPATIAGWRGRGTHVITFNEYLAKRDAEWMRKIYDFCGVRVAHIEAEMPPPQRRNPS